VVVGTGTPASCTEATLNAALAQLYPGAIAPGGTLSFNCGPNPHTIIVTSQKFLQDGSVIDGGGLITLSGGDNTRIFFVTQQARVELDHIKLINGNAAGGGAIFAEPNLGGGLTYLTLNDVTLSGNTSSTSGGAIIAEHTALTLINSHLTQNSAILYGGAISLYGGALTMSGTQVLNNTAQQAAGGGMKIWNATLDIQTSTFQGNKSLIGSGGALSFQGSTGTIATSQISQNSASTFGGGIECFLGCNIALSQVTISSNSADKGGGIFNEVSTISLDSATLSGNVANLGGEIFNFNAELTLSKSTLVNNQALGGGGGILHDSGATAHLAMVNTIFSLNTALAANSDQCLLYKTAETLLFNLWSGVSCGSSSADGNQPNTLAQLAALNFSGSGLATELTQTHALLAGSPAIDAGTCGNSAPATDQRGVARPYGAACDIGAYEFLPLFADNFDTSKVIPSIPYRGTDINTLGTTTAVDDPAISSCNLKPGLASVWYSYTPAATQDVNLDTLGSNYDTLLAVWTGTRGSLSPVVCNDDSAGTTQSGLWFSASAGTTYYIEIAQWNGLLSGTSGKSLPGTPGGTLQLHASSFSDVPGIQWAWRYIESIYSAGITGGCGVGPVVYCPNLQVTRAQMAVFLLRGIHGKTYLLPAATGAVFTDVPANCWAAGWIEQFFKEGITQGCGVGLYCPDEIVTRAQMAVFLLRAKYGSTYLPPPALGTVFDDVPANAFAAAWIEKLYSDGITTGCGVKNYCPNAAVSRDQMAVFIQRVFNLPLP